MRIIEQLFATAETMHREGAPPHDVAVGILKRASQHGLMSIIHRSSPPKLEILLDGAEHVIGFNGTGWAYKLRL